MVKISKLFGMLILGLASSGLAETSYFTLKDSVDSYDQNILEITQVKSGTKGALTWSDLVSNVDEKFSELSPSSLKKIVLSSDLDFGGHTEGSCNNPEFVPLPMVSNSTFDGNGHKISGFCYVSDVFNNGPSDLGFFYTGREQDVSVRIDNVTFENAYVNAKNALNDSYAGVLFGWVNEVELNDVVIHKSTVQAMYAGGMIGYAKTLRCYGNFLRVDSTSVLLKDENIASEYPEGFVPKAYLGGIVGYVNTSSYLSFGGCTAKNVVVKNEVEEISDNVGGFVGYASSGSSWVGATNSSVVGSVVGNTYVGGLIGTVSVQSGKDLMLYGNSVIGEVSAPRAGYLVGNFEGGRPKEKVYDNYYYAKSATNSTQVGLGYFSIDEWNEGTEAVYNNFRNATSLVAAIGMFDVDDDEYPIKTDDFTSYKNGVVEASVMKSPAFTGYMNGGWSTKWSIDVSGKENDGLPFVAYGDYKPVYAIVVHFSDVYASLKSDDLAMLESAGMKTEFDEVGDLGKAFINAYLQSDGTLPADLVQTLNGLNAKLHFINTRGRKMFLENVFTEAMDVFARTSRTINVKYVMLQSGGDPYASEYDSDDYVEIEHIEEFTALYTRNPVKTFSTDDPDVLLPNIILKSSKEGVGDKNLRPIPRVWYFVEDEETGAIESRYLASTVFESAADGLLRAAGEAFEHENLLDNTIYVPYQGIASGDDPYYYKYYKLTNETEQPLMVKSFMYKDDGSLVEYEIADIGSKESLDNTQLYTMALLPDAPAGYKLDSYTVTVSANDDAETPVKTTDGRLGDVSELINILQKENASWKAKLSGKDTLFLDNFTLARLKERNSENNSSNSYFNAAPANVSFAPTYSAVSYTITFEPQGMDVFFGDSWKRIGVHSLASKDSALLPAVYSTESIFIGWSTEHNSDKAKSFTNELSETVLNEAVIDENNSFRMYSHWENKYPELRQVYLEYADDEIEVPNGTLSLVQSYYDIEKNVDVPRPHTFEGYDQNEVGMLYSSMNIPAAEEPMTFRVEAVPNLGYKLESLTWRSNKPKKEGYGLLIGTDTTFRVEAYVSSDPTEHYLVAKFAPVPYRFTFNRELGTDWFYAKDWRDTAIYTIDAFGSGQSEFPRLYSVKGWTEGWYARLDGDYDCSPTFYPETSCMETGAYRENDTLHVFVYEEDNSNEVVSINKDAANMVRLVQFIGSKDSPFGLDSISHSFMIAETDGEMLVPRADDAEFEFVLRADRAEGLGVDSVVMSYMMEGQDGPEPFEETLEINGTFFLNIERMRHVRFDARIRKLEYQITFENPVVEGVMVDGENFDKKGYSVDSSDFSFPNMIYTNESCLLGWKLKSSEDKDNNDLVMKYFNWEDAKLMAEGENVLTAAWGDGAACDIEVNDKDSLAGEYARLALDAVGGNIQLIQMSRDENDEVHEVRTRQFGAGKFMLFPIEFRNETWFIVNIKADEGYVAPDSILFYYDAKRAGEFAGDLELDSLWLKDGDKLPGNLFGSVLKADFRLANDTPIEFASTPEFRLAGSAARLNFVTSEFAVDRNVLIKMTLTSNGDAVVVVDSVKEVPYEFSWKKVGLAPGKYDLSVQMFDATESASFDTSFVINSGVDAVAVDGWQMLALSVIDKKSIDWTDSDAVFYWWDESSSIGEYWQYQAYGEKDEVDAGVGGWYSSLSGNSLAVRDTEIPERVEWLLDSVNTGWNMVANPYGWVVALPDMSFESYRWNSEICDYDSVAPRYLKPYEAIWIHVGSDTVLTLDKTPVFDTATVQSLEKHHALAKANSKFDWSIRASLKDEKGRTDSWNVLGVGDEVKMEEPPEGMGNHVRLSVMDGRKRLAKSMKAASEEGYTWNLEVSASSDRRGFLSFEGLDQVAAFGYRLFVTVDDRTVELSAGEQMPVALKTIAKSVKVQVVKSEAQLATSVSGLKMVQQGNMVNVSFNVPSSLAGSGFVAEVAGLDGKILSSRFGKALSGRNEVSMDFPKSGLYFVRVRVASQQTAGKFLAK